MIIKREMTITYADFFRLLPKALHGYSYQQSENAVRVTIERGSLVIHIAPEQRRKAGALELPVTLLSLDFDNTDNAARRKFLEQFDMTYHREGG